MAHHRINAHLIAAELMPVDATYCILTAWAFIHLCLRISESFLQQY